VLVTSHHLTIDVPSAILSFGHIADIYDKRKYFHSVWLSVKASLLVLRGGNRAVDVAFDRPFAGVRAARELADKPSETPEEAHVIERNVWLLQDVAEKRRATIARSIWRRAVRAALNYSATAVLLFVAVLSANGKDERF
jgi:hypothetical protein